MAKIDLSAWDAEIAGKTPDYEKLYQEMLQATKESPESAELWSRMAHVTYQASLNYIEEPLVKAKTQEAFQFAEKALNLDANQYRANLWMAVTAGKLALMGSNIQAKIKFTIAFLRALGVCSRSNPKDPLVLFMEGRLQLALASLTEEEKNAIQQQLPLPEVNWVEAEAKLRESIERDPTFIDGYITLAYLMVKCKKFAEAKELIQKGLAVERLTKSDHEVAAELQKLEARIKESM